MGALLRFHFKVNPNTLDDDSFSKLWGDLVFCLNYEAERYKTE